MELTVHGRHIPVSHALANHAQTRLGAALGQHNDWVKRVDLCFEDVNGPRGGVDKKCKALINLQAGTTLMLEEMSSNLYEAIDGIAHRHQGSVIRNRSDLDSLGFPTTEGYSARRRNALKFPRA